MNKGILQQGVKGICSGIQYANAGDEVEIVFDHNNVQLVRRVGEQELFPTQTANILPLSEKARVIMQEVKQEEKAKKTAPRKQKSVSAVKADTGQSSMF